jgi:Family of unknown function (DUF6319)
MSSDALASQETESGVAEETTTADAAPAESAAPAKGKARKQSTARKTRTVELTLSVTGTAEGEWQAEVRQGTKRVVPSLAIPAAAVSRAAKELHPDVFGAIDTVITTAREEHEARLRELEAELERTKKALAELQS